MNKKLVADELIRIAKKISAKESGKVEEGQQILDKLQELGNFLYDKEDEYNDFVGKMFSEILDKINYIQYNYLITLKSDKEFSEIYKLYEKVFDKIGDNGQNLIDSGKGAFNELRDKGLHQVYFGLEKLIKNWKASQD